MVLDAALFSTLHHKVRIKGKVEQSREEVAPSPTPQGNSYWKGSLQVALDYSRQLYFISMMYKKTMKNKQIYSPKSSTNEYWKKIHLYWTTVK